MNRTNREHRQREEENRQRAEDRRRDEEVRIQKEQLNLLRLQSIQTEPVRSLPALEPDLEPSRNHSAFQWIGLLVIFIPVSSFVYFYAFYDPEVVSKGGQIKTFLVGEGIFAAILFLFRRSRLIGTIGRLVTIIGIILLALYLIGKIFGKPQAGQSLTDVNLLGVTGSDPQKPTITENSSKFESLNTKSGALIAPPLGPMVPAVSDNEIQARVLAAQRARETEIGNTPIQTSNTEWVVKVPNGDTLNVRSGPGVSFPIVAKLPPETKVQSSGELEMNGQTEWLKIDLLRGEEAGWAVKAFLIKSQKANLPNTQSLKAPPILQSSNGTKINFKCPNCAKLIEVEIPRNNVNINRPEVIGSTNYPAQVMRCPSCSSMIHIADESELRRPENQSPRTISGSDGSRYLRYPNGLLKVLY